MILLRASSFAGALACPPPIGRPPLNVKPSRATLSALQTRLPVGDGLRQDERFVGASGLRARGAFLAHTVICIALVLRRTPQCPSFSHAVGHRLPLLLLQRCRRSLSACHRAPCPVPNVAGARRSLSPGEVGELAQAQASGRAALPAAARRGRAASAFLRREHALAAAVRRPARLEPRPF